MEAAISLPDILYEKAEQTASYMGIPRNTLFSMAVEEFIERHNGQLITEKINAVYETIDQKELDHCFETKDARRQRILGHFGTWDDEDVETIEEIVAERAYFSKDRDKI